MAAKNDITGDLIKTKANSDTEAYADGWERIFGKKKPTVEELNDEYLRETYVEGLNTPANQSVEPTVLCDVCGKELSKTKECAWTSCPLNWNEARADIIGQNGNIGYGDDAS